MIITVTSNSCGPLCSCQLLALAPRGCPDRC